MTTIDDCENARMRIRVCKYERYALEKEKEQRGQKRERERERELWMNMVQEREVAKRHSKRTIQRHPTVTNA